VCPDCGERDEIFGHGGGDKMARQEKIQLLGTIPLYPEIRGSGDAGVPITAAEPSHPASKSFIELAKAIVEMMPEEEEVHAASGHP
jgi:ATP-binding protein involved in chromosome partitioning